LIRTVLPHGTRVKDSLTWLEFAKAGVISGEGPQWRNAEDKRTFSKVSKLHETENIMKDVCKLFL